MHLISPGLAANDLDNPMWAEAMNCPNTQGICTMMDMEIKPLKQDKDTWDIMKHEP
jgi:hypothetical protein